MFLHCQNTVLFVVYYSFIFVIATNVKKALYRSFRIKQNLSSSWDCCENKPKPLSLPKKNKTNQKNCFHYSEQRKDTRGLQQLFLRFDSSLPPFRRLSFCLSAHHAGSSRSKRNTTPSSLANSKSILRFQQIVFLHIYALFMYSALEKQRARMRPW